MLAIFMAQKIVLNNDRYKFKDMPVSLKPVIAEVLIESGCTFLIDDEAYLPKE